MQEPTRWIEQYLIEHGVQQVVADPLAHLAVLAIIALLAVITNFIAKRILLRAISAFIAKTKTRWDDYFVEHHVFDRLSHMAPAMVLYASAPIAFPDSEGLQSLVRHAAVAYMTVFAAIVVDGVLNGMTEIYGTLEISRTRPIRTYVQVIKIIVYLATGILIVATLTGRSAWGLLSGLGAMTAILMLVFKDTILGFVASVQVSANDMVRPGDWIEMSQYGADGDVIEVNLNTVKIRNWDKTISTIPTYALVSETFRNWRGMKEAGGRRIKRAIWIDQTSVRFCDDAMLDRIEQLDAVKQYLRVRREEVLRYNREHGVDTKISGNGRRLTNIGTFRAYALGFLKRHPKVRQDLTLLVRQLPPGPTGIGIELYCFSSDTAWPDYEAIQADIFDHMLAVLPLFELRVYQQPGGADLQSLLQAARPADRAGASAT